ncbi:MAG TPA: hypothetical protein VFE77_05945 [Rhodanobacter sp.]|nr:hypothetical protein [Rhodanobacter sp.]
MKTKDKEMEKRGADNTRHEQEDVALRDHAKQREAGVKQYQEKARKQKQKQKDSGK